MRDVIYAPSPLHGVLPGIRTQNLLIKLIYRYFPQVRDCKQVYSLRYVIANRFILSYSLLSYLDAPIIVMGV